MAKKLRLREETISQIGVILASISIILTLASMLFTLLTAEIEGNFVYYLVKNLLNIIFYFFILVYFNRGKTNGYFNYVAICMLLISNYIIPTIFNIIQGLWSLSFNSVNSLLLPISTVLGIVYFIILILNAKERKSGYLITLVVLGTIMFIFAIFLTIGTLVVLIKAMQSIIGNIQNEGLNAFKLIFGSVLTLMNLLTDAAFAIIYFLYPLYIKKY